VAVVAAGLLLMLSAAFVWGGGSAATEHAGAPEATRVVTVAPGDTLWDIAADIAADGQVRSMVDRIDRLNALDSAMLQSGQRIRVPVSE
jgi:predicted Zn-dependent protease